MVLTSLAEAGVDPDNAVVIGDTRFDIEMAVNAGVTPIGVAWGYHEPQSLLSAGAQEIAPDFPALTRKILDRFCLVMKRFGYSFMAFSRCFVLGVIGAGLVSLFFDLKQLETHPCRSGI